MAAILALAAVGCGTTTPANEAILARRALTLGSSRAESHWARGEQGEVDLPPLLTAASKESPLVVRTLATRTVATKVNLLQPVYVGARERGVAITYAERGRNGVTVVVDPATLEAQESEAFTYDDPRRLDPTYLGGEVSKLELGGSPMVIWNDDTMGRVIVVRNGQRVVVSPPETVVVGSPRVATTDGRRAVVAFLASDGDTAFSLVAVAIEAR